MPNGKTQDSYAFMLSGWHLFLPFRLISRKSWYMLLTYEKAEIINIQFWFILVCSDLLLCRELCAELTGYVKQNKHRDFIVFCQQGWVRGSVQPPPVPLRRCGDADLTWSTLELCCRAVVPVGASSPAEARRFPMGFLSFTQKKRQYKSVLYEKLGLAIHHHFCSLLFSCRMLVEELNRFVGCFGGFLWVTGSVKNTTFFLFFFSFFFSFFPFFLSNFQSRILQMNSLFEGIK